MRSREAALTFLFFSLGRLLGFPELDIVFSLVLLGDHLSARHLVLPTVFRVIVVLPLDGQLVRWGRLLCSNFIVELVAVLHLGVELALLAGTVGGPEAAEVSYRSLRVERVFTD